MNDSSLKQKLSDRKWSLESFDCLDVVADGVIAAGQIALLFLDLAAHDLSETDRNEIVSMLEPALRDRFREYVRVSMSPSEVESNGEAGKCVIVEGFTRRLKDRTQFTGYTLLPNANTFTMIPMLDMFDVYEFFDEPASNSASAVVAAKTGSDFPDGTRFRFSGYVQSLLVQDESTRTYKLYLEANYFTRHGLRTEWNWAMSKSDFLWTFPASILSTLR